MDEPSPNPLVARSLGLSGIADWLLEEAWRLPDLRDVIEGFFDKLADGPLPLLRGMVIVQTLHPQFVGYGFIWKRGEPLFEGRGERGIMEGDTYKLSPMPAIIERGETLRVHLEDQTERDRFSLTREIFEQGGTDYVGMPLEFSSGQNNLLSLSIDRPGGYSNAELAAFPALASILARVLEPKALQVAAVNLLDTYVGQRAGERILKGQILRSSGETINAAIWLCDLRGFTRLSDNLHRAFLIDLLNQFFDCVGPAVQEQGGEVLKFMGDGMLAVFPAESEAALNDACDRALKAAGHACRLLDALNVERQGYGEEALDFGLALHVGDVMFGNVGSANRLDFTVIGPAVNMAARLERLCGSLGERIVVSKRFADLVDKADLRALGPHPLRGLAGEHEVFAAEAGGT